MKLDQVIKEIYHEVLLNEIGDVASYIPQLGKVNPDLFGISICTVKGDRFDIGDTGIDFCIQSCSKPLTYCMAQDIYGIDKVHQHVGHEPSGRAFNAFALDDSNLPHNPLINAGAIMICSMLNPDDEPADRFDLIKKYLWDMCGSSGRLGFDNSVYLSEKRHSARNRALAHYMDENNAFPERTNLEETIEFYFQICSILTNTNTFSEIAATLANFGVNPLTNNRVFSKEIIRNCLSLMFSCGMYDYSGKFSFEIGIPAKSGVSGCVYAVIPNVMGICVWSPRLDKIGNSVRGVEVCRKISEYFNFHIFDQAIKNSDTLKDTEDISSNSDLEAQLYISYASKGDINKMKTILDKVDIDTADYDKRTALHLAAAEGHYDIVDFLIKNGADIHLKDRWGNTAYHEAKINQNENKENSKLSINYQKILDILDDSRSTDNESNI